jgi:Amidases related to nicotinamidase
MPFTVSPHAALLVVDVQPDFMPGGALACHEGDAIVPGIDALLRARAFRHVAATQDWHPPGHASFASSHAGRRPFEAIELAGQPQTLWPDHCVQGSAGAALDPRVDWSALDVLVRKGSDPRVDSYSGFRENHGPHGDRPSHRPGRLAARARRGRGFPCAAWRATCACCGRRRMRRSWVFRAHLLWGLSRPVTPDADTATRAALQARGIGIVENL